MKNRLLKSGVLFLTIYFLCWMFHLVPFVIDLSHEQEKTSLKIEFGDTIRPLESLDIENGQWEMFIKYSFNDLYSDDKLLNGRVFRCTDRKIMLEIRDNLSCIYTGADMATVDSKFYVYNNGKLMFVSHCVIDKNSCGIQSQNYGWVTNKRLKALFSNFKIVHAPFIFFRVI